MKFYNNKFNEIDNEPDLEKYDIKILTRFIRNHIFKNEENVYKFLYHEYKDKGNRMFDFYDLFESKLNLRCSRNNFNEYVLDYKNDLDFLDLSFKVCNDLIEHNSNYEDNKDTSAGEYYINQNLFGNEYGIHKFIYILLSTMKSSTSLPFKKLSKIQAKKYTNLNKELLEKFTKLDFNMYTADYENLKKNIKYSKSILINFQKELNDEYTYINDALNIYKLKPKKK